MGLPVMHFTGKEIHAMANDLCALRGLNPHNTQVTEAGIVLYNWEIAVEEIERHIDLTNLINNAHSIKEALR
jgi:hypothetical protein